MEREDSNWREKTKRVNNWRTIICMTLVALNPPGAMEGQGRKRASKQGGISSFGTKGSGRRRRRWSLDYRLLMV